MVINMKILFVHISDLNFRSTRSANLQLATEAARSAEALGPFDGAVLIFSGDLTTYCNVHAYKAVGRFAGMLMQSISEMYSVDAKDIKLLVTPGNSDMQCDVRNAPTREKILSAAPFELIRMYTSELLSMRNFFAFSDSNNCFLFRNCSVGTGQSVFRKMLHFSSGYILEALLLNTAPFSGEDDIGLHWLPDDSMKLLSAPSDADLAIAVAHHPPVCFTPSEGAELTELFSRRYAAAFFGCDHGAPGTGVWGDDGLFYQTGAPWSSLAGSSFLLSKLDTETLDYTLMMLTWDRNSASFSRGAVQAFTLPLRHPIVGDLH